MIVYVNGIEYRIRTLAELEQLIEKDAEMLIGKCVVCGELCNNKSSKVNSFICSIECMGG